MTPENSSGGTAFVLAGGGSLGAVQVGMLAELIAAGVRPDMIVGVSAGAINGAFLAHDPNARTIERMAALWSRITTKEVLGLSWRSLLGLFGLRDHIANPQGLRSLLRRELPYQTFNETAIPLHLVCADLVTGDEVVISRGNVAQAIIASAAIPGVFPPVQIDGRYLVDGAVAACTPISVAAALGATRVIVLPCGFACAQNTVSKRARAGHARDYAAGGARVTAGLRALLEVARPANRTTDLSARTIRHGLFERRRSDCPRPGVDAILDPWRRTRPGEFSRSTGRPLAPVIFEPHPRSTKHTQGFGERNENRRCSNLFGDLDPVIDRGLRARDPIQPDAIRRRPRRREAGRGGVPR
ncbi:MAG: patatin-like phospholipase family protein [Steroidobacteraceae bacterium]